MNFGEIKSAVQIRLARTNTEVTNQIPIWIKERQRLICLHKNWWFLKKKTTFNTAVDTQEYSLPTDFKDDFLLYITVDNVSRPIYMISPSDAVKYYLGTDKGRPEHFVLQNGTILLYPIPDKTYTITNLYYCFLPDLSADTDTNILSIELPEVLISGALSEGFSYLQEFQDAAQWEAKYQNYLRELNTRDIEKRLPSELVLTPRTDVYGSGLETKIPRPLEDWY